MDDKKIKKIIIINSRLESCNNFFCFYLIFLKKINKLTFVIWDIDDVQFNTLYSPKNMK